MCDREVSRLDAEELRRAKDIRAIVRAAVDRTINAEVNPVYQLSLQGYEKRRSEKQAALDNAVSMLCALAQPAEGGGGQRARAGVGTLQETALTAAALAITALYRGEGGWCGLDAAREQARVTLLAYQRALSASPTQENEA